MERVVSTGVYAKGQQAYNRWIDHAMKCAHCRTDKTQCETAQGLWQAYRDARGP